mmetsp:Transcript_100509/g.324145  ORF Transcript_100509/g.324145 Transcript_100509/m.324145 type:complete len:89 (-) Transcript_100509:8-274(-)
MAMGAVLPRRPLLSCHCLASPPAVQVSPWLSLVAALHHYPRPDAMLCLGCGDMAGQRRIPSCIRCWLVKTEACGSSEALAPGRSLTTA